MRAMYKTKVNDNYFDVIDTEKKAYILGFLIAEFLSRKKLIFDTEISYSSRNGIIDIVEHRAEKI